MDTTTPPVAGPADAPDRPATADSATPQGDGEARQGITLPAVERLREQFESGALGWEEALEVLKGLPKPWATPEWKAWRDEHIGDACAQCGGTEGPMVLQHLHQPLAFSDLRKLVRDHLWGQAREAGHGPPEPELVERDACPECGSTNIRWYKTRETWRCMRTERGRQACGHEFTDPARVTVPDTKKWAAAKEAHWREWTEANADLIGQLAVALGFEQHREYLSMAHTTTFCKRCAFLWDQKGLRLCGCGRGYHGHHNLGCRDCWAEGRVGYSSPR